MRSLCAELLAQVNARLSAVQNGDTALSPSEIAAIRRILDISARVVAAPAEIDLRESTTAPESQAVVASIRAGQCDGEAALFAALQESNRAKLSVISPKSLERYVGLTEL